MEENSLDTNTAFTEEVKAFFNQPQLYLKHEFGRNIRREILAKLVGGGEYDTMIDIGCGDGSLSRDFLGKCGHITLVDISSSMLALAKTMLEQKNNGKTALEFVEGNFSQGHLPVKKYDLVLCIGVLAHVENVLAALDMLFSLANPSGTIALQFSDHRNWMTRLQMFVHRKSYPLNHIELPEVLAHCQKAGYQVERRQQFGFFFPGMSRMPGKWLYKLQRAFYRSRLLSEMGADFILILRKNTGNT